MTWLAFCQRHWPTYPWTPEGCRLRPFTRDEIAALGDPHLGKDGDNLALWKFWKGSYQVTDLRGVNPHGLGKLHVDRNAIVKDVPFWATKWLVFERDRRCQDCGCFGWESHWEHATERERGHDVYDRPILQADVDAHNVEMMEYAKTFSKPSPIKDWYRYATPEASNGLQVHHIVAVVDGGSNCTHNLMLLCWKCHLARKGKGGVPTVLDGIQARLA